MVKLTCGICIVLFVFVLYPSLHSKVRILWLQTLDWWDYSCTFPCDIFGVFWYEFYMLFTVIIKLPTFIIICCVSPIIFNSVCFTKLVALTLGAYILLYFWVTIPGFSIKWHLQFFLSSNLRSSCSQGKKFYKLSCFSSPKNSCFRNLIFQFMY